MEIKIIVCDHYGDEQTRKSFDDKNDAYEYLKDAIDWPGHFDFYVYIDNEFKTILDSYFTFTDDIMSALDIN